MNCPKCNSNIPNDSIFCPDCGCNIEKAKQEIQDEQALKALQPLNTVSSDQSVALKKNKSSKVLTFFLIALIICCCVLCYLTYSFYNQTLDLSNEIDGYVKQVATLELSNKELQRSYDKTSVARAVLSTLHSSDRWGYSTENFHANTGVVCLKSYQNAKSIEITMNYNNTTCHFDYSSSSVINAYWSDKTWYSGEPGIVYLEPRAKGVSVLTFTNDAYNNAFKVLVIVED